jgi:hypothetical protein
MIDDAWIDGASPARLEALAQLLIDGKIAHPFAGGAVEMAGFKEAAAFLRSLRGTDHKVIAWALRRIARERSRALRAR